MSFEQCDVDDLWISIKLKNNKSFIVGSVYRLPSTAFDTFKENSLNVLDLTNKKNKYYTIGGDININWCH